MFNLFIMVIVVLAALARAEDCMDITSESSCLSASCSWCESAAVGGSCASVEQAATLPSSVFSCTTNVATAPYLRGVRNGKDFACGDYNNDCTGCVQAAPHGLSQCTFCPVDGICHTVGSLVNKCTNEQCISVARTSTCENTDISACSAVNQGSISWMFGN